MSTQSLRRPGLWPGWFTAKWGASFIFEDANTLCSPRMEIKNVVGFLEDYARALRESGFVHVSFDSRDYHGGRRELAITVALLWDCGGVQAVRIWSDGPEFWSPCHNEGCEHDWRTVCAPGVAEVADPPAH